MVSVAHLPKGVLHKGGIVMKAKIFTSGLVVCFGILLGWVHAEGTDPMPSPHANKIMDTSTPPAGMDGADKSIISDGATSACPMMGRHGDMQQRMAMMRRGSANYSAREAWPS